MYVYKIISTLAFYTGYYHDFIHKTSEAGKEREEMKEERIKKILEEERKKVQPVYNLEGKIIKPQEKNLDIKV